MKYDKHKCNEVCGCGNHTDAQRIAIELTRHAIHNTIKGGPNCAVMLMAVREHFDMIISDLVVGRMALEAANDPSLQLAASIAGKKPASIALDFALDQMDDARHTMNMMAVASMYENETGLVRRSQFICEELGGEVYKDFFSEGPTKDVLRNAGFTFEGDPEKEMTPAEAAAFLISLLARKRT